MAQPIREGRTKILVVWAAVAVVLLLLIRLQSPLQPQADVVPSTNTAPQLEVDGESDTGVDPSIEGEASTQGEAEIETIEEPQPIVGNKVAVIVENRPLPVLVPLLLHFASVLGPDWPVLLYTWESEVERLQAHPTLQRWAHQIGFRTLLPKHKFETHGSVSRFFTETWFWEDLAPADHVLLFQTDSIICSNTTQSVDDFLQFDFIGAPIGRSYGAGYNGGLSLRNRNSMLTILNEDTWEPANSVPNADGFNVAYEDQWFAWKMHKDPRFTLPTADVALTFSVETVWGEKPLGFHQMYRFWPGKKREIEEWCPEHRLVTPAAFF
jgi:hypothetical protein